jgi:hypothetical protein
MIFESFGPNVPRGTFENILGGIKGIMNDMPFKGETGFLKK